MASEPSLLALGAPPLSQELGHGAKAQHPALIKHTETIAGNGLFAAVSSMQGRRPEMEVGLRPGRAVLRPEQRSAAEQHPHEQPQGAPPQSLTTPSPFSCRMRMPW
jgi:hypothetical protein